MGPQKILERSSSPCLSSGVNEQQGFVLAIIIICASFDFWLEKSCGESLSLTIPSLTLA